MSADLAFHSNQAFVSFTGKAGRVKSISCCCCFFYFSGVSLLIFLSSEIAPKLSNVFDWRTVWLGNRASIRDVG